MTQYTLRAISGRLVDLANPQPDQIDMGDVAWGLSEAARFVGHTSQRYSVAQHSVMVMDRIQTRYRAIYRKDAPPVFMLWGLLHDGGEGYLGDLPGPAKKLVGDAYKAVELRLWRAILEAAGIPEPEGDDLQLIKAADDDAYVVEVRDLRHRSASITEELGRDRDRFDWFQSAPRIWPLGSPSARHDWLNRYRKYHRQINAADLLTGIHQ